MKRSTPAWLVFLIAVAVVFGVYYLWRGFQSYVQSGGLGVIESTSQAVEVGTATAQQIIQARPTARPTFTPIPDCVPFVVSVPSAIVREAPATNAPMVTAWDQGTAVCVVGRAPENAEWYIVDGNPATRRIDFAYMHETIIEAVNPTLTPSRTFTPPPTVTPLPTEPATRSPTPAPTATIDPDSTDTPTATRTQTPTITPTPTIGFGSA
jgi:hypothetical protein